MSGNMTTKLREGIDAAKRGDKLAARRLLLQVLSGDANNELALMWMASVVDTLNERRFYLERALQVNPDNNRAREALHRLGVEVPAESASARSTGSSSTDLPRLSSGSTNVYLIAAAVVAFAVVAVVVMAVVASLNAGNPATPTPDVQATFAAMIVDQTNTPTPDTRAPTATVLPGIIVSLDPNLITLPPSFTPTFTPLPTETPSPTVTPLPLSSFMMIYSDVDPGASLPSLYRGQANGIGEVKLAAGDSGGYTDVAVDPTGQRIAFVRYLFDDAGNPSLPELFVANIADPTTVTQLTSINASVVAHPAWSPDGRQIVFSSDGTLDGQATQVPETGVTTDITVSAEEIWIIDADGSNLTRLTGNDARDFDPSFSPDGKQIVYASDLNSPGFSEIYTMSTIGANITQLTDDAQSSYSPAWSPDGTRIAFVSNRGGDGDIYVMDADGQRPFLLTVDDNGAEDRTPAWTPDSRWIVFASNRQGDHFRWYAVDLAGDIQPITSNDRNPQSISFITR